MTHRGSAKANEVVSVIIVVMKRGNARRAKDHRYEHSNKGDADEYYKDSVPNGHKTC